MKPRPDGAAVLSQFAQLAKRLPVMLFRLPGLPITQIKLAETKFRHRLPKFALPFLGFLRHLLQYGHGLVQAAPYLETIQVSSVGVEQVFVVAVGLVIDYELPIGFQEAFLVIRVEEF